MDHEPPGGDALHGRRGIGGVSVSLLPFLTAYREKSIVIQRKATALFYLLIAMVGLAAVFILATTAAVGFNRDAITVAFLAAGLGLDLVVLRSGKYSLSVVLGIVLVFVLLTATAYVSENHGPLKLYNIALLHILCFLLAGLAGTRARYAVAVGVFSILTLTHYFVFRVIPAGLKPFEQMIDAYIAVNAVVIAATLASAFLNRQLNSLLHGLLEMNESLEDEVTRRTQELRESQRQLIEAEKLASLGGVVAGLSHEINTPLGVSITAQSHLQSTLGDARKQAELDELDADALQDVFTSADELSQIVTQNLRAVDNLIGRLKEVMSQRDVDPPELISVRTELEDIFARYTRACDASEGVTYEIVGDPSLQAKLPPHLLWNVMPKFLDNAFAHAFPDQRGRISVSFRVEEEVLVVVVADNGRGMNDEARRRLFEPFYTTRRGEGRIGLGLHIAYHQIRRAGGTVSVQSSLGLGSIFTIRIPCRVPR